MTTAQELIGALALPETCLVRQRVPKKLLAEHGATTAQDRQQIQSDIEEVVWVAALKPHLIGVPSYHDADRQYVELAVLTLQLRAEASGIARLAGLVHRAIPYPVLLLITAADGRLSLSLGHLRGAQNDADKMVLDGPVRVVSVSGPDGHSRFLDAMALHRQPQTDLQALYQGWIDTVDALDMAQETGVFQVSETRAQAVARHEALQHYRLLQTRIAHLQAAAAKERQLARQVALNQDIRAAQTALQAVLTKLQGRSDVRHVSTEDQLPTFREYP